MTTLTQVNTTLSRKSPRAPFRVHLPRYFLVCRLALLVAVSHRQPPGRHRREDRRRGSTLLAEAARSRRGNRHPRPEILPGCDGRPRQSGPRETGVAEKSSREIPSAIPTTRASDAAISHNEDAAGIGHRTYPCLQPLQQATPLLRSTNVQSSPLVRLADSCGRRMRPFGVARARIRRVGVGLTAPRQRLSRSAFGQPEPSIHDRTLLGRERIMGNPIHDEITN